MNVENVDEWQERLHEIVEPSRQEAVDEKNIDDMMEKLSELMELNMMDSFYRFQGWHEYSKYVAEKSEEMTIKESLGLVTVDDANATQATDNPSTYPSTASMTDMELVSK